MLKRRVLGLGIAAAVAASVTLVAQKKDDKKQSDAQKKEIQNVVKIVDGVITGQPAPNDLSLAWVHEDMLKAQGNKQYLPFNISIDPSKVSGGKVTLYWRVVAKDAAAAAPVAAGAKKDDKKDDKKGKKGEKIDKKDLKEAKLKAKQAKKDQKEKEAKEKKEKKKAGQQVQQQIQ